MGSVNRLVSALALTTAFMATACTSSHSHSGDSTRTHAASATIPTISPASSSSDSVDVPPQIDDELLHLASTASRRGSATVPFERSLPTGALAFVVACQGKGSLSLDVSGVSGITVGCGPAVAVTYNVIEFETKSSARKFEVKTDPQTRWAISVGSVKLPEQQG